MTDALADTHADAETYRLIVTYYPRALQRQIHMQIQRLMQILIQIQMQIEIHTQIEMQMLMQTQTSSQVLMLDVRRLTPDAREWIRHI